MAEGLEYEAMLKFNHSSFTIMMIISHLYTHYLLMILMEGDCHSSLYPLIAGMYYDTLGIICNAYVMSNDVMLCVQEVMVY